MVDHLAIFVGMRPGEILGLQRRHVGEECFQVLIEQRTYRGVIYRYAKNEIVAADCCGSFTDSGADGSVRLGFSVRTQEDSDLAGQSLVPGLEAASEEGRARVGHFQVMRRTMPRSGTNWGSIPKFQPISEVTALEWRSTSTQSLFE